MNSIPDIIEQIANDKQKTGTYDRYPIRFLFMDLNDNTQEDIISIIAGIKKQYKTNIKVLDISDDLSFDDAWITKNKMLDIISSLDVNTDYFVTGFSELARFYSRKDLEALLLSFMTNIENTSGNKQRIYFVCFSLFDKIAQELKTNNRNESIDPIVNGSKYKTVDNDIDKICVYYTNTDLSDEVMNNRINSSKEWLSIYKNNHIDYKKGIICVSNTLVMLYEQAKPDNFVDIEKLDSYYKLLLYIYGMKIRNAKEDNFDHSFWKCLYDYCRLNDVNSLDAVVKRIINVNDINDSNIFELIISSKKVFNKQLLHLYLLEHQSSFEHSDYLMYILEKSKQDNYINIEKTVITDFSLVSNKTDLNARRFFSQYIPDSTLLTFEGDLAEAINRSLRNYLTSRISWYDFGNVQLTNINIEQLSIETKANVNGLVVDYSNEYFKEFYLGRTLVEKSMLLSLLQNKIVDKNYVFALCPDYQFYLGDSVSEYLDNDHQFIEKYIFEYKTSKLFNYPTEKYLEMLNNIASDFYSWYYSEPSYQYTLDIIHGITYDKLFVFDGVGAEYFDYLLYLIKKHDRIVTFSTLGKTYLPSITSINKDAFGNNYDEWVPDFDESIIHGTIYNSAINVAKSLYTIEKMFLEVINRYPNELIAITADHGCTAAGKLIKPSKKYDFSADHEGRCAKVKKSYHDTSDYAYITSVDNNNWLVATREISLDDNPKREAHGGATFEEVFVPIIVFGDKTYKNKVKYDIQLKSGLLSGLNRSVSIEILPPLNKAPTIIETDGTKHIMKKVANNVWTSEIDNIQSQLLSVIIENSEYKVSVGSSLGANQIGEDGFDD